MFQVIEESVSEDEYNILISVLKANDFNFEFEGKILNAKEHFSLNDLEIIPSSKIDIEINEITEDIINTFKNEMVSHIRGRIYNALNNDNFEKLKEKETRLEKLMENYNNATSIEIRNNLLGKMQGILSCINDNDYSDINDIIKYIKNIGDMPF